MTAVILSGRIFGVARQPIPVTTETVLYIKIISSRLGGRMDDDKKDLLNWQERGLLPEVYELYP
jgi:hypothetical protein